MAIWAKSKGNNIRVSILVSLPLKQNNLKKKLTTFKNKFLKIKQIQNCLVIGRIIL
jgi:hypothetical protein